MYQTVLRHDDRTVTADLSSVEMSVDANTFAVGCSCEMQTSSSSSAAAAAAMSLMSAGVSRSSAHQLVRRQPASTPLRKLSIGLIHTYKHINEVSLAAYYFHLLDQDLVLVLKLIIIEGLLQLPDKSQFLIL